MTITQAEARRLRQRVKALEGERKELLRVYGGIGDFPGVWLGDHEADSITRTKVDVAQNLNHVVFAKQYNGKIQFFAVPAGVAV